ncbi:MAG: fumarate reductase/succinate dehydrogenase flavoprotein domain-containing protein [Puniceicoccaceae bacterium 5H]|nr:MAG: fumarate reductase/succinate dehydrogenase flavoprotein domain-containing protein [Puniceicoccaceae bacterium 5H]
MESCLVIGAGISGLLAGLKLHENAVNVTVIEKSRGLGGRMATRRQDGAIFDHGAQFMTTRNRQFREMVERWLGQEVVKPWYIGPQGNMRYVGAQGMTTVPKFLAKKLTVHNRQTATALAFEHNRWKVTCQKGEGGTVTHEADFLILTCPVPQSLKLLLDSEIELDYDDEVELKRIQYRRCISVLAQLNGPAGLPAPGAMDLNHPLLRWIGDNSVKGISDKPGTVTIHSSPQYAMQHWDSTDEDRIPPLLEAAKPFLKSAVEGASAHRWRYSEPTYLFKEKQPFRKPYYINDELSLGLCGDGFGGPRIEAAALSGLALGEDLMRPL